MKTSIKLPKKQFYLLVISMGVILLALSAEVMLMAKDMNLYDQWFKEAVLAGLETSYDESFSMYLSLNLSDFFLKAIVPMAMGVYTYFAYVKIRVNKLFVFIWTVLLVGAAAYVIAGGNFDSVFFYIILISYLTAVISILSLVNVIDESKYV